jgi:hypothetical protein
VGSAQFTAINAFLPFHEESLLTFVFGLVFALDVLVEEAEERRLSKRCPIEYPKNSPESSACR